MDHTAVARRSWLMPVLGAALLLGAIVVVWRQRELILAARDSMQHVPPSSVMLYGGVIILTVIGNLVLTGCMFSVLMAPQSHGAESAEPTDVVTSTHPGVAGTSSRGGNGRVGWLEMQALIASSTLLNFLPLRPGLFGRVAYHKTYNNIPVARSMRAIVEAVALSVTGTVLLILAVLASSTLNIPVWLAVMAPLAGWTGLALTRHRRMALAGGIRLVDLLMTAGRYFAAFQLIGSPIDSRDALGFACISTASTVVPLFGSGLGVREWAIGLFAPILTPHELTLGLTADLLNRAVEVMIVVLAGLIGMMSLSRMRSSRSSRRDEPADSSAHAKIAHGEQRIE